MSRFSVFRNRCVINYANIFLKKFYLDSPVIQLYHNCRKQQVNIGYASFRDFHIKKHMRYAVNESKVIADTDTDLYEFNNAYEVVRNSVLKTDDPALTDAVNWSAQVLDYNAQGGKKNRGVAVLRAYKILSSENPTSEGILLCSILGWCVEMLQAFFIVLDDIMDHSTTRRGKPCWYQRPDVGLAAINDALLLESGIYKILDMHVKKSGAYNNILHEFLQVTRKTAHGQALDMLNVPPNQKPRFENFNMERYEAIVRYKTSYYTFCLPVHLAMHLKGNFSVKDFEATENICLKLGLLFQVQDDYLDAFGDPRITGKIGTDIVDGKCTWLAVSAFEQAPDSVKQIMTENYGVNDTKCASKVMKLYEKMNLETKFYEYEEKLVKEINSLIANTLSGDSLQNLFLYLLQKTHKRKK